MHQPAIDRILDLLASAPPMPLDAGIVDRDGVAAVRALTPEELFGPEATPSPAVSDAVLAGLLLRMNDLDGAHRLCQAHEDDATNNYWHAILHRREGDFSNSKYWLRRVAQHPVIELLPRAFREVEGSIAADPNAPWSPWRATLPAQRVWTQPVLMADRFDAAEYVDRCAQASDARSPSAAELAAAQSIEWTALFAYAYARASR